MSVTAERANPVPWLSAPRFIGRAHELELLTRALADRPAAVLVEGEAGVGKSRLIREYLKTTGRRTLVATCPPYREPSTLAPIVNVLQHSRDTIAGLPLTGLAGALRPLFPEWAADLPPAPEPLDDPRASRHRLFRAMAALIDTLDADALVVEDIHWADEATLEFLLFLTSRPQSQPVGIVVTYRPEEVIDNSPVRRLAARLPAGPARVRITLQPLGPADTAGFISSMLGAESVTDAFAAFMHAHTDGIPLAIEESMRLLGDRAHLVHRDGAWVRRRLDELQVPPTVRDTTLERAQRLSPPAQRVLAAAAVLGAADERILAEVADLAADQVRAPLAEAFAHGLLVEPERERVAFRHALMGRAVYEAVPEPNRRHLHRVAGLALERTEPTPLAELTHHFREAGDTARWAAFAEQTADRAIRSGDHTTAVVLLHDLLSAVDLPAATRARVARTVATAALARSDAVDDLHHRVVHALRAVLDSAGLTRREQAEIRNPLGRLLILQGDADAALTELAQAVDYLDHDPFSAARAMTYLGWAIAGPWPASTHRRWLRRAANVAGEVRSPIDRMSLTGDRAAALLMLGDEAAWDLVAGLPSDAATGAERRKVARINANVGKGALMWGRYGEARDHLATALALAESEQVARLCYSIKASLADLDWFTGQWDGLAARVDDLADADRDRPVVYLTTVRLAARLDAASGRSRAAEQRFQLALDEAGRLGAVDDMMEPAAALGQLWLAEGRVADALRVTERAMEAIHTKRIWLWATELAPARVRALLAAGRCEEADVLVNRLARGLRGRRSPAPRAALALCRALVTAARGDEARAAAAFGRAARAWDALPRPYDALLSREMQGHALLAAGRKDAALDLLSEVRTGLGRLGATGAAKRVTLVLREHGIQARHWRGGRRGYGGRLSPREVEVVRLVVAGKTNREIAEQLSKSPRTVEGQVHSAMAKLSVTSRTTLAVAAVNAGVLSEAED